MSLTFVMKVKVFLEGLIQNSSFLNIKTTIENRSCRSVSKAKDKWLKITNLREIHITSL